MTGVNINGLLHIESQIYAIEFLYFPYILPNHYNLNTLHTIVKYLNLAIDSYVISYLLL